MAVEIEMQDVQQQEEGTAGGEPQGGGGGKNEQEAKSSKRSVYLGLVVVVIGFASCVLQLRFHGLHDNCSVAMNDGAWIGGRWQSHRCIMHYFQPRELHACLLRRPHVIVIGSIKGYYWRLKESQIDLQSSRPTSELHIELLRHTGVEGATLNSYKNLVKGLGKGPGLLALHKVENIYRDDAEKCMRDIRLLLAAQEALLAAGDKMAAGRVPPAVVTVLSELTGECLEFARELYTNSSLPYVHLPPAPTSQTGHFLSQELNMILNILCNSPINATCCVPATMTSSLASYVYMDASFLLLLLALYLGIWLIFVSGATFAFTPYFEAMSCNLDKFFTILHSVGGTCTVLFYMLLADRLEYFTRVSKHFDLLLFGLTVVVIIIATTATITRRKKREYLGQDQADEWRGWMIIALITVSYTDLDEAIWMELICHLFVGGYLFLSGYTHFTYFWYAGSISCKRVLKVLLELNFLPLCVCLSLGSSYGAYYLIPLLSFNFLFTVAFVAIWPSIYSIKQNQLGPPILIIVFKFALAFVLISYLLPLAKELLSCTPLRVIFQSFDGCPYAIYNWFYQQRYMTLMGMGVAIIAAQLRGELLGFITRYEQRMKLNALVWSIISVVIYIVFLARCKDKEQCLGTQAYIAILPLLSYTYFRNCIKLFEYYTSRFLSQAGSISIWLFISHYHILLAKDGKGLLVLLPRFQFLNTLAVVTVYVFFFFVVHRAVRTLEKWLRGSRPSSSKPVALADTKSSSNSVV